MGVDEDETIDPRGGDDIGRHPRSERAPARAPILPRVAEIRDDAGKPLGAVAAAGVGQQEQFDQVHIRRRARRLDEEHIPPAHRFTQLDLRLAIGEPLRRVGSRRDAQFLAHRGPERAARRSRQDRYRWIHYGLQSAVHGLQSRCSRNRGTAHPAISHVHGCRR